MPVYSFYSKSTTTRPTHLLNYICCGSSEHISSDVACGQYPHSRDDPFRRASEFNTSYVRFVWSPTALPIEIRYRSTACIAKTRYRCSLPITSAHVWCTGVEYMGQIYHRLQGKYNKYSFEGQYYFNVRGPVVGATL